MTNAEWLSLRDQIIEALLDSLPLFQCIDMLVRFNDWYADYAAVKNIDEKLIREVLRAEIQIRTEVQYFRSRVDEDEEQLTQRIKRRFYLD